MDTAPSSSTAPSRSRANGLWRDLVAVTGGQLIGKLFGFVAFAYLARTLSPEGYGAVEYAAGLAFVAGMFIDAGFSAIGVRTIARDPKRIAEVSAVLLGARFLLALATAALLAASAGVAAPDPFTARLILLFSLGLLAVPFSQLWLFQATDRIPWTAAVQGVRMAVFLAAVLLLVRDAGHALRAGVAEVAALTLSGALALELQRRFVTPVRLQLRLRPIIGLIRESLPVGLSNLVAILTDFSPLLLAVNLVGTGASAHFAAAHRLYFALTTLCWLYHFNLFPVIARASARDPEALGSLVASSLRFAAWTSAAGALVLTLLAPTLMSAMFGPPFADAALPFAVLIWALPVKLLADHGAWLLIAVGRERSVLGVQLAGLAVAFAAGVPMVRAWGPIGGAVAMLAATIVLWAGMHTAARRRFGWMPWTPALGAGASSLGALWAASSPLLPPGFGPAAAAILVIVTTLWVYRRIAADARRLARAKAAQSLDPADAAT